MADKKKADDTKNNRNSRLSISPPKKSPWRGEIATICLNIDFKISNIEHWLRIRKDRKFAAQATGRTFPGRGEAGSIF